MLGFDEAKYAYNTAIARLNLEAQTYINSQLSPMQGARTVGTDPLSAPILAEENNGTWSTSYETFKQFEGQLKPGDNADTSIYAYELGKLNLDYNQMKKSNIDCAWTNIPFWMGVRYTSESSDGSIVSFQLCYVETFSRSPYFMSTSLVSLKTLEVSGQQGQPVASLRPVFTLKETTKYRIVNGNKVLIGE